MIPELSTTNHMPTTQKDISVKSAAGVAEKVIDCKKKRVFRKKHQTQLQWLPVAPINENMIKFNKNPK
jgi:hypothetical protein